MTSLWRRLLAAVFMLAVALPAGAQSGSPATAQPGSAGRGPGSAAPVPPGNAGRGAGRGPELWWREHSPIRKELGLSKDQATQIEKIFQDTRPALNKQDQDLKRRESMLSGVIRDNSPESIVLPMINHVEVTRAGLNTTRQLMLYRMRLVLTTSQQARFETLHAQWQAELQQAEAERQQQAQKRRQDESQKPGSNQKLDQRPSPDRSGRP